MLIWFRFALIESQWIETYSYTETHTHKLTLQTKKQKKRKANTNIRSSMYNKMRFMVSFVSLLSVQKSFTVWKLSISFPTYTLTRTRRHTQQYLAPSRMSRLSTIYYCVCAMCVYIIANSQVPDKTVRFTDQRARLFISRFQKRNTHGQKMRHTHTQQQQWRCRGRNTNETKEMYYKEINSNVSSANRQNKEMRECVFEFK